MLQKSLNSFPVIPVLDGVKPLVNSILFVLLLMSSEVVGQDVAMYDTLAMKCQNACNRNDLAWTNIFMHVPLWLESTFKYSQAFFECACSDESKVLTGEVSFRWAFVSLSDEVIERCKTAVGETHFNGLFMIRAPAPMHPMFSCNIDSANRKPIPYKPPRTPQVATA